VQGVFIFFSWKKCMCANAHSATNVLNPGRGNFSML
jgi:hypothetical protein